MLRCFLNVGADRDFVLVVAWALAVLRDRGPYPLIVLAGEQGSAKSTFSSILRALLDPNVAPLRALSREDRDLFISANNGYVLTFENVSRLPDWISDTLCRLATGGGFAVRQLYTDQDEVLFDAARPLVLNGIEDFVTRPDLADRSIFLTLQAIPEARRRSEKRLWADFKKAQPQILGALLDTVSHGIRQLPHTQLGTLPRMADFALWATACEDAIWSKGTFMSAYTENRDEAVHSVIESDPVASAIRSLMASQTTWTGNTTDLLDVLSKEVSETVLRMKSWPSTPQALANQMRRAATFLRKIGISVEKTREGRARTRTIHISFLGENERERSSAASATSAPSITLGMPPQDNGKHADIKRTNVSFTGTTPPPANDLSAHENTGKLVGADDADAQFPTHSSRWRKRI
jgi:hypothetical protein